MAIEDRSFGTLGRDLKRRDNLTLVEARVECRDDRADGVFSEVVRYLPTGFIDDTFDDDVVLMHSRLMFANTKLAKVQEIIDLHSKGYNSVSDEVYETNPVCEHCNRAFPCDTRAALEDALRN